MSATIESTFIAATLLDARREPKREQDAAVPPRDGERRPAAQQPADGHETPCDGAYVADWVI